jgi:CheY-like chemotaxis protein
MKGPLQGKRILIVEDEAIIAMYTEDTLTDAGADVVGPVANLAGAFNALAENPALDAVTLDLNLMGETSGPFADALAERRVPFVMLTGYDNMGIPAAHRARPIVGKPYNPEALIEAIVSAIDTATE